MGLFDIDPLERLLHSLFRFGLPLKICRKNNGLQRKRRGRPKIRRAPTDGLIQGGSDNRIYQCTFCTGTFKSRHDWTRHKRALHLTLEQWTCMPFGPSDFDADGASPRCSLCDKPDPSYAHIESHRASVCVTKPLSARVFHGARLRRTMTSGYIYSSLAMD